MKRKEEQQKIKLAKQAVDKANSLVDPLEPFPVFKKYCKNDIDVELCIKRVTDVDEDTKQWFFNLTKRNVQHL